MRVFTRSDKKQSVIIEVKTGDIFFTSSAVFVYLQFLSLSQVIFFHAQASKEVVNYSQIHM